MKLARRHLRDELGHVQLFAECLKVNGVAQKDLAGLRPKTFTKAVFGYLLATIQHENEYVANVAIMQVMESIGVHFFSATLDAMRQHGMAADAIAQHPRTTRSTRRSGSTCWRTSMIRRCATATGSSTTCIGSWR